MMICLFDFGSIGVWTPRLKLARQALYHLSFAQAPNDDLLTCSLPVF
jgi:hypothetical protein